MVLPIAILAATSSSDIDMVFNARFYKQGKAKSTYQVFLANHTGAKRKQISVGNFRCDAPLWVDRNHVAYVQILSVATNKDPDDIDTCKARVMLYDLESGRTRTLGNLPDNTEPFDIRSRGNEFTASLRLAKGSHRDLIYKVSVQGLKSRDGDFPEDPEIGTPTAKVEEGQKPPRKTTITSGAGAWDLAWTPIHKEESGDSAKEMAKAYTIQLKSTWKGKTSNITLRGEDVEKAFIGGDGTGIIMTSVGFNREYHESYLYRFDKGFGSRKLVCHDVGYLVVNEDQPLWHGYQTTQGAFFMEGLKDGRGVYANWLYTGNWKTGEQWTVLTGLVNTGSVRFRPLK